MAGLLDLANAAGNYGGLLNPNNPMAALRLGMQLASLRRPQQQGAPQQPMPQGPMVQPGAPVPAQLGMPSMPDMGAPPNPASMPTMAGDPSSGTGYGPQYGPAMPQARPRTGGPMQRPVQPGGMSTDALNNASMALASGGQMPQGMDPQVYQNLARFYGFAGP